MNRGTIKLKQSITFEINGKKSNAGGCYIMYVYLTHCTRSLCGGMCFLGLIMLKDITKRGSLELLTDFNQLNDITCQQRREQQPLFDSLLL